MQFNRRRPLHCRVGIQFDTLSGGFGMGRWILKECALICARFNTASSARWKRWTGGALCAMRGGARRMNRCAETGYLVLEGGALIERGIVGFSHVRGDALPPSATVARPRLAGCAFEALGVSAVLHPSNPYCPTAHLNVRLLAATPRAADARPPVFWFGGALDLTPYYGFEDDAR